MKLTSIQEKIHNYIHGDSDEDWTNIRLDDLTKPVVEEIAQYFNEITTNSFEILVPYQMMQNKQHLLVKVHPLVRQRIVDVATLKVYPDCIFIDVAMYYFNKKFKNSKFDAIFSESDIGKKFYHHYIPMSYKNKTLTLKKIVDLKKDYNLRNLFGPDKVGLFETELNTETLSCPGFLTLIPSV